MAEQPGANAPPSKLGIATTSYMGVWRPQDTLEFLEHCHRLGAAGIQAPIRGDPVQLRARAQQLGMYIEAWSTLPQHGDTSAFEQSLKTAQAAGAVALRTACLGTRRYETFKSLEHWHEFVKASDESIAAALPILDRYKIPLGLENHKDWTADEMDALLERHSNQYLGVCLDFGNNISLLDDPMYVVQKLAPYTVSTHLKDMAVERYADGFLLSEVVLGNGFLDLPRMIALVRQSRPETRFSLEMITRDPLKVPCLNDDYWITFPDRNGLYLARTLKLVEKQHSPQPLPRVSQLNHDQQLHTEEENVVACMRYANAHLNL
jgi:sugar phosphate isomerase/epimerase